MKTKLFIIFIQCFTISTIFSQTKANKKTDKDLIFSFMAISDIHSPNYNSTLTLALNDAEKNKCSTICLVGDLTEKSTDANFTALMSTMNTKKNITAYYTIGNHDVRWLSGRYTEAKNRFLEKTAMPAMHYDKWISGYHFIFLASDEALKDQATLSTEQLTWLNTKLAEQASEKKPIFVFLHQALINTVVGTYPANDYGQSYPDGVLQNTDLKSILAQFPQTIFITGHTHESVIAAGNLYKDKFTMINDGSIMNNEGLIFNVYRNKVEIKGRNFASGRTIANWTLDY